MSDPRQRLAELVARVTGGELVSARVLGPDDSHDDHDATAKAVGYGEPVLLGVELADGRKTQLVFHTAGKNSFGHDFRADRAAEMLLAYDTFGTIDRHVAALDVGAVDDSGALISLAGAGEMYLLSQYAPGSLYADDLRRVAASGLAEGDVERAESLATYLASLHREPIDAPDAPALYRRTLRDLVGSGEGIFGLIDNMPQNTVAAPASRLQTIEAMCNRWRWRLLDRSHRLRRIHGDMHPFNIVFSDDGELALLDTSRGSVGDPANDVTCLAINFAFFALGHRDGWHGRLRTLWYRFWSTYADAADDPELFDVLAPYLAWRALVLANPLWYPDLAGTDRGALLGLVERVLTADRFHPEMVESLFSSLARRDVSGQDVQVPTRPSNGDTVKGARQIPTRSGNKLFLGGGQQAST